jgi:hypothetical protein
MKSKGFTIKGALAFVEKNHGAAGKARVLQALDPEDREVASRLILSSEWVPFKTQVALYEAIDKTFGKGDFLLCRDIGRFTSEYELTTINMIFLKLGKLEHWFRAASLMWGRYYSEGSLEVGNFEKGGGSVVIRDFDPISDAFCRDFSGWLERTVELSGHQNVSMAHPQCVLSGQTHCEFRAWWEEK